MGEFYEQYYYECYKHKYLFDKIVEMYQVLEKHKLPQPTEYQIDHLISPKTLEKFNS